MKALVTGASGQVGRALVSQCPAGWRCQTPGRGELDLADPAAIRAFVAREKPDIVFNAAAYTAVDRAESEPELAHAINAAAPGAFADALAATGGRLVQLSTDFVFDGAQGRPYRPDDPRRPLSVYGQTKAAGEDAAGPGAIVVRTSWVHAAGGANFVRKMIALMNEREELRVVADQIGAPTWATGLAAALWTLGQHGRAGIWHYRDCGVASWYDFAEAIGHEALALGLVTRVPRIVPVATDAFPTPARRPGFSLLDIDATSAFLGEAPAHWRANLKTMLQEERALG